MNQAGAKWKKGNIYAFAVIHLLAALALLPWFFSWTGVVLLVAGAYVFGVLGINISYHRLLTHRSFTCPRWLEYSFAFLAACSLQDSPPHWVAVHRRHHQYADKNEDPHSPLRSFFWSHMGWLLVKTDDMRRSPLIDRYARDIIRDPFYAWLERRSHWMIVGLFSWMAYFTAGFIIAAATGASWAGSAQFGCSILVWGAILRTVVVWHLTWSVNSVTHVWGYRNYETPDVSRNNVLVAMLVSGEGWHNNHHADPRSARHGHKWYEFDLTWLVIRLLMTLGLAKNVAIPSPVLAAKFNSSGHQPLTPPRAEPALRAGAASAPRSSA